MKFMHSPGFVYVILAILMHALMQCNYIIPMLEVKAQSLKLENLSRYITAVVTTHTANASPEYTPQPIYIVVDLIVMMYVHACMQICVCVCVCS